MFARLVEAMAKPGKKDEIFAVLRQLVAVLKKQQGFVDLIALAGDTDLNESVTLTLWRNKKDAETFYKTREFAQAWSRLEPLVEDIRIVRTFRVEDLDVPASNSLHVTS